MTTTVSAERKKVLDEGSSRSRAWDMVGSEWVKLRSLRSTYWVILAGLVISVALCTLDCNNDVQHWDRFPDERGNFDTLPDVFNGFVIAQMVFATIGVLSITGEYASGLIRTTLTAVPARRAALAAKAAAVGVLTFVTGAVAVAVTFGIGQAILSQRHMGQSVTDPVAVRALAATVVYLVATALLGLGLGVLLRHAAAAISALFALLFLLPILLHNDTGWALAVENALPGTALRRLIAGHPWSGAPSTGAAWLVVAAYPLITLFIAGIVIHHRDA